MVTLFKHSSITAFHFYSFLNSFQMAFQFEGEVTFNVLDMQAGTPQILWKKRFFQMSEIVCFETNCQIPWHFLSNEMNRYKRHEI